MGATSGLPHLVDERGKLVVEGLDLLPLLSLYLPNLGVNLHIEGLQEALVALVDLVVLVDPVALALVALVQVASLGESRK